MAKGKGSQEEAKEIISVLPECEKYMIAMLDIKNASKKFDAMLFKVQFDGRLDELVESIEVIKKACNEVRSSERLRKMFAMILTLVNQINTGGDGGNLALGFNLEALLKLGEAKAFDKKTSVLEYLAKLIRRNDEELLNFKDDLGMVPEAEGVILDGIVGDMKALNEELQVVSETAKLEADVLEQEGKLPVLPNSEKEIIKNEADDESGDLEVSHKEGEIPPLPDCENENNMKNESEMSDDEKAEPCQASQKQEEGKTPGSDSEEVTMNLEKCSSQLLGKEDEQKETSALDDDIEESKEDDEKKIECVPGKGGEDCKEENSKILDGDAEELNKTDGDNTPTDGKECSNDSGEDTKDSTEGKNSNGSEDSSEKFIPRTVMEVFTWQAKKRVDNVLQDLNNIKESYVAVLKYFGEDEKMPSNEFFGILQKFMDEFKVASEKVEKLEKLKVSFD